MEDECETHLCLDTINNPAIIFYNALFKSDMEDAELILSDIELLVYAKLKLLKKHYRVKEFIPVNKKEAPE